MRRVLILLAGLVTGCGPTTSQPVDHNPPAPVQHGPIDRKVYLESEVDTVPTVIRTGRIRYPDALRAEGIGGRVVIEFVVDTTGRADPTTFTVISTPHPEFADSARELVRTTVFRPGLLGGEPVAVKVRQNVNFSP